MSGLRRTGGKLEGIRDALTPGDVVRAVKRINRRVRRDRREAKAAAHEAYLRSLTPRLFSRDDGES